MLAGRPGRYRGAPRDLTEGPRRGEELGIPMSAVLRTVWPSGGPSGAVAGASLLTVPALVLEPVSQTFSFGQINLVLMAMVAVDCLLVRGRWPRGVLVGLAAAIKLT